MAKNKRKKKIVLGIVLLAAAAAYPLYKHFSKHVELIAVEEDKVTRRNITEKVVANGKIEPVVQIKISPEVSGEIIELPVKEGEHVNKGDLLVRIKPDNYRASRNSAEANYRAALASKDSATANLRKAELEFKRNDSLFKDKLISESDYLTAETEYDVAKTALESATEQVEVARSTLQSAETDLSKTTIYAPRDGTITKLESQLGERVVGTAMMAGTEIMILSDLNAMEARVDIGEMDVVLMKPGEKANLEVDSFKGRKFEGTVTDVANSANNDNTSSTSVASSSSTPDATKFQVRIRLHDKENFLPGMSVSAEIESRSHTNVLSVPIQCVTTRPPLPHSTTNAAASTNSIGNTNSDTKTNALVAANSSASSTNNDPVATSANTATNSTATNSAGSGKPDEIVKPIDVVFVVEGDHVRMAPVVTGISDDNFMELSNGVREGEQIVSGNYKSINHDLSEGTKVTIKPHGAASDSAVKPSGS